MTTTVLTQGVGCRVRVRSNTPSQVRVRRNRIVQVSAGVAPITKAA